MAKDRTNMVSLLDIGSLMGGKSEKLAEMGDGFTELSEDWRSEERRVGKECRSRWSPYH